MPAKPSWFHRIEDILEGLRRIEAPLVDRRVVQKLFALRERRAQQLMRQFSGYQLGNGILLDRAPLIARLEQWRDRGDVDRETCRKRRVALELKRCARTAGGLREIYRTSNTMSIPRSMEGLPVGVHLMPGELRIEFFGAEDLLRHLFELSQAITHDYMRFQKLCGG